MPEPRRVFQCPLPESPVCVGPVHDDERPRDGFEIIVRSHRGDGLCDLCFYFYNRVVTRKARREALLVNDFHPVTEEGRVQLNKWLKSVDLPLIKEAVAA